jgi:nucleotide-binding universal stress UspA family protein
VVHVAERHDHAGWNADDVSARWLQSSGVEKESLVVRSGFPWVELVRYAHESQPLMIVVGSHGTSGFQPLALGSTAGRMGVLSPFPVLVVTGSPVFRRNHGAAMGSFQT